MSSAVKSLWREWNGPLTRDLVLEPAAFGLGHMPARLQPDATTTTVCGYCSTGCGLNAHLKNGEAINLGTWPGGINSRAYGINNAGQIVGEGDLNGNGLNHALLWTVTATTAATGGTTTNTAPAVSITAVSSTSLKIGSALQLQGSFKDPDNGPWNFKVDWGDGSVTTGSAAAAGTVSASHAYRTASPKRGFSVVLSVTDAAGASGSSSAVSVRVSK